MTDPTGLTVNIAVSGDFKQLQLVPEFNKIAKLGRVYYARGFPTMRVGCSGSPPAGGLS